jgi:hypothetical protein
VCRHTDCCYHGQPRARSCDCTRPSGQTVRLVVDGQSYLVEWDSEPGEEVERHHYLGTLGRAEPLVWVDRVLIGGRLVDAMPALGETLCARLDAVLMNALAN